MSIDQLTPEVSTHFRWMGDSIPCLSKGKIYRILKWDGYFYFFLDDAGDRRRWWCQDGVEDISYEGNLEKILE